MMVVIILLVWLMGLHSDISKHNQLNEKIKIKRERIDSLNSTLPNCNCKRQQPLNTTSIGNRKLHNAYNLMSWHFLTQTKRKDTTTKKKKLTKKKYNAKISEHKEMLKFQWHKINVAKWEEWSTMKFMCRGHQLIEHEWWL